jgi:hypothetical protein
MFEAPPVAPVEAAAPAAPVAIAAPVEALAAESAPIPAEGLPPGWTEEQWGHYGGQWLAQEAAKVPEITSPSPAPAEGDLDLDF